MLPGEKSADIFLLMLDQVIVSRLDDLTMELTHHITARSRCLSIKVVLATDQVNARSILMYQQNLDKIAELSSHSAMGVSGPNCDLVNFSE